MAKNHLEKSKNPAKRNFKKIVKKQKFTHTVDKAKRNSTIKKTPKLIYETSSRCSLKKKINKQLKNVNKSTSFCKTHFTIYK